MRKIAAIIFALALVSAVHAQPIERALQYDKYTLADTFMYAKTERHFQWGKVREMLLRIEQMQARRSQWGVLQNKSDIHGRAPLVGEWHTNEYKRPADRNGTEQRQGIPLYSVADAATPELYARDGSPVRILDPDPNNTERLMIEGVNTGGKWSVPRKYVKSIGDTVSFRRVVVVDRTMQTVMTIERVGDRWLIRSMNPATTGAHNPPFQVPTPLGIYVVQEKRSKMLYTKDGSSEIAGYAPWASRFSAGGFVHGVPVNGVDANPIEFSQTLGSIPRSHMCVRNATSHAKFVYDWAPVFNSLVAVIE